MSLDQEKSLSVVVVQSPGHVGTLGRHGLQHARPPVLHHLPEFVQGHRIGDTVQPSHPLAPSSPSALNLSQHQGRLP